LANADGTNPVDLTNNTAYDQQPAWSVDGQWIAFTSNQDGNYEIYITKPGTLELYNLTNHPSQDQVSVWH
jgi:tricorn protease